MKTSLLKGITDEDEKRRIEESFLSSRKFRERLQVLLEEKYESDAVNVMTKVSMISLPSFEMCDSVFIANV